MRIIFFFTSMLVVLAASMPTLTLYDGSDTEGNRKLPAEQGTLSYRALNLREPLTPPKATQTYDEGRKLTVLDTSGALFDAAGYGTALPADQSLSRATGFTLSFTIAIDKEEHANNDRAGWSVLLLADDTKGIELGFWKDQIWAQEGNANLFKHAETAQIDVTILRNYELSITGDSYVLSADGREILRGAVRDYSAFQAPVGAPNPYRTPNVIFFGDNTSSASGTTAFAKAALVRGKTVFLPYIAR